MTDDEFRSAFEAHQDAVFRFPSRMVGPDSAEDLAQDVFLTLLRHPQRFDRARHAVDVPAGRSPGTSP